MKKLKKYLIFPLLLGIIVLTTGCPRIKDDPAPPPSSTGTVSVPLPVNSSNCFSNHHIQGGTDTKISLRIYVTSYYYVGNSGRITLDSKVKVVDPNVTSFPVSIDISVPTDRPVEIETIIEGEHCSECGSTRSANQEGPGGNCFAATTTGSDGVLYYAAAIPRWMSTDDLDTYRTTSFTLTAATQITNKPKTCDIYCTH